MDSHILDSDLSLTYTEIMAATRPEDVFGPPATQLPLPEQQAALKKRFTALETIVDPTIYDRVIDANAAQDARETLLALYTRAEASLVGGVAVMDFTVRGITYHVGERIALGEHSVLHRAITTRNEISDEVVLKIGIDEASSAMLKNEAEYLRLFAHAHDRNPITRVRRTLPKLVDTFDVEGRQVNVLPYWHGYRNIREIVEHFDHALPVGHAAWIARRVLALPLTASLAGLHHNAVTPEHVLVHPVTHEPIYIGWAHATPLKHNISNQDMRMTGEAIWYLLGNPTTRTWNTDVPKSIADMVERLTASDVEDLPRFFTDFTNTIYRELGKRYRPLELK